MKSSWSSYSSIKESQRKAPCNCLSCLVMISWAFVQIGDLHVISRLCLTAQDLHLTSVGFIGASTLIQFAFSSFSFSSDSWNRLYELVNYISRLVLGFFLFSSQKLFGLCGNICCHSLLSHLESILDGVSTSFYSALCPNNVALSCLITALSCLKWQSIVLIQPFTELIQWASLAAQFYMMIVWISLSLMLLRQRAIARKLFRLHLRPSVADLIKK